MPKAPKFPSVGDVKKSGFKVVHIAAASVVCCGCFTYVPTELVALPEGSEIRVRLSRQALAELPEIPDDVGSTLRGTFLRNADEQLVVRVPVAVRSVALVTTSLGQDITVPWSQIIEAERREFSRVRTVLLLAGGAAAVVAFFNSLGGEGQGGQSSLPPPPIERRK
jgi:hypothetical protein